MGEAQAAQVPSALKTIFLKFSEKFFFVEESKSWKRQ